MKKKKTIEKEKGFEILSNHGFDFDNANKDYVCYRKHLLSSKKQYYKGEGAHVSVLYFYRNNRFGSIIHIDPLFKDREYIDFCEKALKKWEEIKAKLETEGIIFCDD